MNDKDKRESGPFIRPTSECHRFAKKTIGGRLTVHSMYTSTGILAGMMNAPKPYQPKPVKPPLLKRGLPK